MMEDNMENTNITCPVVEQVEKKQLSQKDAVFNFFSDAVDEKGTVREEGQPLKVLFTKDIRKVVRQRLIAGIKAGEISCKKQYDDKALAKYCSGLISNWLDKDKRYEQL